jgi:FMN phosphatase YigB (HAD superfamily)
VTADATVYLFDVDNTLLDNDAVAADLRRHLTEEFGEERQQRYWEEFERLREELGYADYLGALQRFRVAYPHDVHLLDMSDWLIDYPFAERLYPRALEVVARVRKRGQRPVILTDGDVVFQPRKIRRSGLWDAFHGDVLVYIHKELELQDVERRYPGDRYVLVDDKLRILAAVKEAWGDHVTTVFPRQGHYATDPEQVEPYPPADVTVERVGDLLERPV